MEDETMFGMSGQRFYDDTDYSKDPEEAAREEALKKE